MHDLLVSVIELGSKLLGTFIAVTSIGAAVFALIIGVRERNKIRVIRKKSFGDSHVAYYFDVATPGAPIQIQSCNEERQTANSSDQDIKMTVAIAKEQRTTQKTARLREAHG